MGHRLIEALDDRHHGDYGRDAYDDPGERQRGAQLIRAQTSECDAKRFPYSCKTEESK